MSESKEIVDGLLEEIITLPSLPDVVQRVSQLLDDPNAALADIGRVVATDPGIALKTLRLVNSAYYGLRNKVTAVEVAVSLLGARVIKNLVLTATVFESFQKTTGLLLRHSVATGIAMGALASARRGTLTMEPSEGFVFGLLHDVGKIILEEFLPNECKRAEALSESKGIPMWQAEREVFGTDHAEVGARLAIKWKLPDALAAAIGYHHSPSACVPPEYAEHAAMVAAADYMVIAAGLGAHAASVAQVSPETWELAGIAGPGVPPVFDAFLAGLPSLDELLQAASATES